MSPIKCYFKIIIRITNNCLLSYFYPYHQIILNRFFMIFENIEWVSILLLDCNKKLLFISDTMYHGHKKTKQGITKAF